MQRFLKMFPNLCFYQLKIDIIHTYAYTNTHSICNPYPWTPTLIHGVEAHDPPDTASEGQ